MPMLKLMSEIVVFIVLDKKSLMFLQGLLGKAKGLYVTVLGYFSAKLLLFSMLLNVFMMVYSTISAGIFNGHGCCWKPPKCLTTMTEDTNTREAELEDQHCKDILDASDKDDASTKVIRGHKIQLEIKKRYLRQWNVVVGIIDKVLFVVCLVVLTSGFLGITFVLGE